MAIKGSILVGKDAPLTVKCQYCGKNINIRLSQYKRYEWVRGQRNFFCDKFCSTNRDFSHLRGKVKHENFFKTINTEAKAYLLGFIFADGCVQKSGNSYRFSLGSIDFILIDWLIQYIGIENSLYKQKIQSGKTFYNISFSNEILIEDLIKHGAIPNKTKSLNFPNTIPSDMIHHFIRGYMDGDGDIIFYEDKTCEKMSLSCSLYGTYSFISELVFQLSQYVNLKSKGFYQQGSIFRFKRTSKQAEKILEYFYKDSSMYLSRKYQKYIDYQNYRNK